MDFYFIFTKNELEKYISLVDKKKHKLIVFDHNCKIMCFNRGIDFEAIDEVNPLKFELSLLEHEKLLDFFQSCDRELKNNNLLKDDFFSNDHELITVIRFYQYIIYVIENIIDKYNSLNLIFFSDLNDFNKYFFNDLKKIYKNLKFNLIQINNNSNFFLDIAKDDKLNKGIIYYLKKIKSKFYLKKRHNILTYFIEEDYYKKLKLNKDFNIIQYENNNIDFKKLKKKIKIDLNLTYLEKKLKILDHFNDSLDFILTSIFNFKYLFFKKNLENLENLYKKKNFKIFLTSHPTLLSCSIKSFFLKKNIPTLSLLHGGNLGHFQNILPFPSYLKVNYDHNFTKNYFSIYTENFLKDLKKNNNSFINENKKNKFKILQSEKIKNSQNMMNKNISKNKKMVGYFARKEMNIILRSNINNHDFKNIYNFRYKFLKYASDYKDVFVNISSYYKDSDFFTHRNLMDELRKNKKYKFYYFEAKKVIDNSNVLIFEQFSTTLLEAISSNKIIIFYNNSLNKFYSSHLQLLKKRIIFVDNENDLLETLTKIFKKKEIYNELDNTEFIDRLYVGESKNLEIIIDEIIKS